MPMHDWTTVKAGVYHNFHLRWIAAIMDRLNGGLLPAGFFAMAEQIIGRPEGDIVTLNTGARSKTNPDRNGGVAVAPTRPRTRFILPAEPQRYARKTNRIAVRHDLGDVVAVVELVSPGNKDRKHSLRTFVDKAFELIEQEVNLMVVDPFPPGPNDPLGVHAAIWAEFTPEPFEFSADKPLAISSYEAGPVKMAYVEPFAVGDRLPNMPLFLYEDFYIDVPLEETYQATWDVLPIEVRRMLDGGAI